MTLAVSGRGQQSHCEQLDVAVTAASVETDVAQRHVGREAHKAGRLVADWSMSGCCVVSGWPLKLPLKLQAAKKGLLAVVDVHFVGALQHGMVVRSPPQKPDGLIAVSVGSSVVSRVIFWAFCVIFYPFVFCVIFRVRVIFWVVCVIFCVVAPLDW
jgi:hypothetical protein